MSVYNIPTELAEAMREARKDIYQKRQTSEETCSTKSSSLYNLRMNFLEGRISLETWRREYEKVIKKIYAKKIEQDEIYKKAMQTKKLC
jgi:hypothetical protein